MAAQSAGFASTISALSKLEDCLRCPICNQTMKEPQIVTGCEHCFCGGCILRIVSINNCCPLCSYPVWKKDVLPNYQLLESTCENAASPSVKKKRLAPNNIEENAKKLKTVQTTLDGYYKVSTVTAKQLRKKNHKGETPLHIATIKGRVGEVGSLLSQGADPNAKDNAGWTPLHEACNHGHADIAEMLLQHGAVVNIPGYDNNTPLHDAVNNAHCSVVTLLMDHGASITAKNKWGFTAQDIATSSNIKDILSGTGSSLQPSYQLSNRPSSVAKVILPTGLKLHQKKQLEDLTLSCKVVDRFTKEVTHVVTATDDKLCCARTFKCLLAISCGVWLLSYNWISSSSSVGQWASEPDHEVVGFIIDHQTVTTNAPRLSRCNKGPGLFNNCKFYFTDHLHILTKQELSELVTLSGGVVLRREPRPLNENDVPLHPWHAKCEFFTKYNVFVVDDDAPPTLYHDIVTLQSSWILKCLSYFELCTVKV